jgi:DNA adenine methylase
MSIKPFLKWAGGKRQVAPEIYSRFPNEFANYFEPFVGAGAIYFGYDFPDNTECFINDYNKELINVYDVVKHHVDDLIKHLNIHENNQAYFSSIRALDRNPAYTNIDSITKASRFIYLNKTSFNGLYRINKNGQFNVPFGHYKKPVIVNEIDLRKASKKLQTTHISSGDYLQLKDKINKGDLVYLDPPYDPLNKTSSFTSYTEQGFNQTSQKELKEFCDYLDSIGAYFIQSNSNTSFINDLYKQYTIDKISARRSINSDGDKRQPVLELLIRNY